jgi:hypothetical protein
VPLKSDEGTLVELTLNFQEYPFINLVGGFQDLISSHQIQQNFF